MVSVLGMLRATGRMGGSDAVAIGVALGLATLAAALVGRATTLVPYRPGRR